MMPKKYNIALMPMSEGEKFIKLSQNYSHLADTYLLGEKSLPHLTLCQFFAEESEVDQIWIDICKALDEGSIRLSFNKLVSTTMDGYDWVALLPDINLDLIKMHYKAASIIKSPINWSFENYDPHITLINAKKNHEGKLEVEMRKMSGSIKPIKDSFHVVLGECDKFGQFTKLIWRML
jgi:2'-5' RNA ligase